MSEKHAENDENYPRENQVKCRWPQPSFELFPLLPKRISNQDVSGGIGRRACEVVKKKNAPLHFRHASQQIGHAGRNRKMNRAIKTVLACHLKFVLKRAVKSDTAFDTILSF